MSDEEEKSLLKALEVIEGAIVEYREDKDVGLLYCQEGNLFWELGRRRAENSDMVLLFTLASVECYEQSILSSRACATSLCNLAYQLGSMVYRKKFVKKAKEALGYPLLEKDETIDEKLKKEIKAAEIVIAAYNKSPVKDDASKKEEAEFKVVWDSRSNPDDEKKSLRLFWRGLDVKMKRDFLKVRIADLERFVKGTKGQNVLAQVLDSAKKERKWTFWMCRGVCGERFSSPEECTRHIEHVHAADFEPFLEGERVKRIGRDWTRKICATGVDWAPLDAEAATEMMKNNLDDVKAFTSKSSKNGWSQGWPLAVDEERRKLLEEIKSLLASLCELKILPCSIRDWLMVFPVKHLAELQVPEQIIHDLRIRETPQSICFLERPELSEILHCLNQLKCERKDGTDLVCKAVGSISDRSRVRENIDFDSQFSLLLVDRRLLKSTSVALDANVTINEFNPHDHYAKAPAQGDDIISWLADCSSLDKFFPGTIRQHNIDIWMAVLKAVQFTCRALRTKYAKKEKVLAYEAALTVVEGLCLAETETTRASLLCHRCEAVVHENSLDTRMFLCAVRDVLKGESHLTLDFPNSEDCLSLIRERKSLNDDSVLGYINLLKSVVTHKVLQIDSKILLIDNSRISLLNHLTKLSFFDHRSYMLPLLKPFLLNEIVNMESNAKADAAYAAEAELLLGEQKKKHSKEEKMSKSKKKINTRNKERTSTSMPSPLEQYRTPSAAPTLKTVKEEESTESEERGRLEISSNTDSKEEAAEVGSGMQNMPGEDSPEYSSVVDMTLKALLNINHVKEDLRHNEQPSYDDQDERVTCALQRVFTAFKSGVLGVYDVLLSDLLASLKDVISMPCGAAEVLVTIIQAWPCWKDSELESFVNRIFLLEENVRMSCTRCKREPNYSEQRSYGIIDAAADSVRDLKRAFGDRKFVDILKLIRLENKMPCDIRYGGCGEENIVRHVINRTPPVFQVVLEWDKSETGKEIYETTKAVECVIDISMLYEGLKPNTNYRLVSMVCCGEKDEHVCLAYRNHRGWVKLRRGSFAEVDVGISWESVVRFCEERKVRPEILFYEAVLGKLWPSTGIF